MLTEAHGIPLRVSLTGGHRNDVTQLLPLVDSIGPEWGKRGRPRRKPRTLYADRGYDHGIHRRRLRERGITPRRGPGRRNTPAPRGVDRVLTTLTTTAAFCLPSPTASGSVSTS